MLCASTAGGDGLHRIQWRAARTRSTRRRNRVGQPGPVGERATDWCTPSARACCGVALALPVMLGQTNASAAPV